LLSGGCEANRISVGLVRQRLLLHRTDIDDRSAVVGAITERPSSIRSFIELHNFGFDI
jgi:hypothetical protein